MSKSKSTWTPERKAKFQATMAAKKATPSNPQDFPLALIPERPVKTVVAKPKKPSADQNSVLLEVLKLLNRILDRE